MTSVVLCCQALKQKIVTSLDSFSFNNPQEKTYIQTDRSQFLARETIWFKTYTTLYERPSVLSKVVYITLSNENGSIIQKKQLKLINGTASGEFDLPENIKAGNYYLNSATLWMLNFPSFITTKKITVFNTDHTNATQKIIPASNKVKIQFFPEGGQLVAGLSSNIAFKAINEFNQPVNISGTVINSKNKAVDSFTTLHEGMGIINFTPEKGETYFAQVTESIAERRLVLPDVMEEGITLTVDNSSLSKCFVKLERAEKSKEKYNNLLLVAQEHYKVVYIAKINFEEGLDAAAVSTKNLPPGILHLTVFTTEGLPLAERSVFVANYDLPVIASTSVNINKRAKNSFEIDLSSYTNPNAAVSVINLQVDAPQQYDNVLSGLLLSSDVKGQVYQPAFYFKDKRPATRQQLDMVMMVNGWTRFKWQEVLSIKFPQLHYPFETGLSVSGKVTHANGKAALQSAKINLIIKGVDSTTILSEAVVNSQSNFVVSDIDFKKEATIYYQGTNQKKESALVSVKINADYIDTLRQLNFASFNIDKSGTTSLETGIQDLLSAKEKVAKEKSKLLAEVVLKSKKISVIDSVNQLYASAIFENSDQTLVMDEGYYFDIWQYLQRMVPGITINKADEGTMVNFNRNSGTDFFSNDASNNSVQLFLNEVPTSASIIESINPGDVAVVKVFKGVTGIAIGANRGAIAIYTKKGISTRDWRDRGFDLIKKAGYNVSREFYAMDYTKLAPEEGFSDVRPTLYWNPQITIKNSKTVIEFFNDDICKKYKVIIEGMDENGKLFSVEKIVE